MHTLRNLTARRAFLRYLAASPVLASAGIASQLGDLLFAAPAPGQGPRLSLPPREIGLHPGDDVVIRSVDEALTLMDFHAYIHAKFPPLHHVRVTGDYYNDTVRANIEGFSRYQLRRRHLTGLDRIDMSVRIFDTEWPSPLLFSPGGGGDSLYKGGTAAISTAAKNTATLMVGGGRIDQVIAAYGRAPWTNMQGPRPLQDPEGLKKFEAAGSPVFVWTIDNLGGGNLPGIKFAQRMGVPGLDREGSAPCNQCHTTRRPRVRLNDPMDVIGAVGAVRIDGARPTWDDIRRVRDATKMKLVLKGIVTREDATLAVQHGIDAVWVSTHGGHEDNGGRGSIECLPEVVEAVGGKIPVLFDSGVRSGVDIFKALALGATAVGVGRAHHWSLASFGQEGVEAMVAILRRELQAAMAQTNSPSIAKIKRDALATRDWLPPRS